MNDSGLFWGGLFIAYFGIVEILLHRSLGRAATAMWQITGPEVVVRTPQFWSRVTIVAGSCLLTVGLVMVLLGIGFS